MARLFNAGEDAEWAALVRHRFPGEEDVDELAAQMLANAAAGDVHIVIACDKAPKGAYDLARSVSAQSLSAYAETCRFLYDETCRSERVRPRT
jgi:hypothetical protein